MIAYSLEYDWVQTGKGWRLRSGDHRAVLEDFEFKQTDARFLNANLTPESFHEMKAALDAYGLEPRIFNVLPGDCWDDSYCVLRFGSDQVNEAVLAQLLCS